MAEFPDVGAHCSFTACNQLDFLPVTCQACKKQFCGVHCSAHGCSNKDDRVIPDELAKKSFKMYAMCSAKECFAKELNLIKCGTCNYNFCHDHRNPETHECIQMTIKRPTLNFTRPLPSAKDNNTNTPKYTPINPNAQPQARHRSIGLIRHKQRMRTRFPEIVTMSFFVHVNKDLFPIIVPKSWTVNHALTSVLEQCNLDKANSSGHIASLTDEPLPDCECISKVLNEGDEVKLVLG
uniref:AN1-type domain-containing protein n=1 Tax=Panagrellus redivivus TaxID=6233 RepID=A0A7E4ZS52_PANRE